MCVSVFRKIEPYVIISIILVPNINKISKNISMYFSTPHTEFFYNQEYRRIFQFTGLQYNNYKNF